MTDTASPGAWNPGSLSHAVLPRRVKLILQGLFALVSDALERDLSAVLDAFELQAQQNAEQALSSATQVRWLETLRTIRRTRHDLIPRFLATIEGQLSGIRASEARAPATSAPPDRPEVLALVDMVDMDESTTLSEIGSRLEMRHSLPIYLLGQRFGVLAGKPAFDAEALPVGPPALCRSLKCVAANLEISTEHRLLLYRLFEKQMFADYGQRLEVFNEYLAANKVLPGLHYVPFKAAGSPMVRAESPDVMPADDAAASPAPAKASATRSAGKSSPAPTDAGSFTGAPASTDDIPLPWLLPGEPARVPSAGPASVALPAFEQIRDLLAARRAQLAPAGHGATAHPSGPVHRSSAAEIQQALGHLQPSTATSVNVGGRIVPRSVAHLKQDLLAQLRRSAPPEASPVLSDEDNDTFDLVGMLFDELVRELHPEGHAANLLTRLQVPLLRVSLTDKRFFNDGQHPARQMLNAVAETGAYWLGDDDADGALMTKMQGLVDRAMRDFDGDIRLFEALLSDLSAHLQTIARKAEVAERRHVEAARGKERLAQARERANAAVRSITEGSDLPVFTRTLLNQAWADVMALAALRHGEGSPPWAKHLETARALAALATSGSAAGPAVDAEALRQDLAEALRQVGYHEGESEAIADRLVMPSTGMEGDTPAGADGLLARMPAETEGGMAPPTSGPAAEPVPAETLARIEQIKALPFGTWLEFGTEAPRVRRRLSWFSPVSGTAMLVNHRGQKVGDTTIEQLAQQLVRGEARLVDEGVKLSLLDRAWATVMRALASFGLGTSKDTAA